MARPLDGPEATALNALEPQLQRLLDEQRQITAWVRVAAECTSQIELLFALATHVTLGNVPQYPKFPLCHAYP